MNHSYRQIMVLSIAVVFFGMALNACDINNTDEVEDDKENDTEDDTEDDTENDTEDDTQPDASADTDADGGSTSLLRMVHIYRRLPDLSLKEFRDHWRDVHAPLVLKHKETLGIHGYAQLHNAQPSMNQMMRSARGTMRCFDGVGEFTIDRDKLKKALETVEGSEAMDELIEDERLFVDFSKSSIWLAEEHVIAHDASYVPPVPANRLTWVGSGQTSLTLEEFQDYYLNNHAPLVAGYAEILGIRDYVQLHTMDDSLGEELRQLRGKMTEPYGIHAEFYWNLAAVTSAKGLQALGEIQDDEKKFIDFSRSAIWTAEEHIFLP